jgi:FeS assembly SUF system protein
VSETDAIREGVTKALRTVHDPEIPVNVYDLGLIYDVTVSDEARVSVTMTLTAPNCPVADDIVADVHKAVEGAPGVIGADVTLVFEPAWTTEKMTDAARLELMAMGVDPDRAKQTLASRPTGLTINRKG